MDRATERARNSLAAATSTDQLAEFCSTGRTKSWPESNYTFDRSQESFSPRAQPIQSALLTAAVNRRTIHISSPVKTQIGAEAAISAASRGLGTPSRTGKMPKEGVSSWFAPSTSSKVDTDSRDVPRTFTAHVGSKHYKLSEGLPNSSPDTDLGSPEWPSLNLSSSDIKDALFPKSSGPDAQDPYSPSAFKNLLVNAEDLLSRLQNAYIQRSNALHAMTAWRDSLAEELDEAKTRANSLRSQLEILAQKGTDQDQRIADLERELQQAKSWHQEELTSEHTSPPHSSPADHSRISDSPTGIHASPNSPLTEDTCPRSDGGIASWCSSNAFSRVLTDIDIGGESDAESGAADSVFSRPRSPALTTASTTTSVTSDDVPSTLPRFLPFSLGSRNTLRFRSAPPPSKSCSGVRPSKEKTAADPRCSNCSGKHVSLAWDTVALLRAENTGLKERIVSLQDGVDEALALIIDCR